jgi:hypothetical protein
LLLQGGNSLLAPSHTCNRLRLVIRAKGLASAMVLQSCAEEKMQTDQKSSEARRHICRLLLQGGSSLLAPSHTCSRLRLVICAKGLASPMVLQRCNKMHRCTSKM